MTLPVFSPREVANIRATKKICPHCKALGMVVVNEPSTLYRCGYVTMARTCSLCAGLGLIDSITVSDRMTTASGEKAGEV